MRFWLRCVGTFNYDLRRLRLPNRRGRTKSSYSVLRTLIWADFVSKGNLFREATQYRKCWFSLIGKLGHIEKKATTKGQKREYSEVCLRRPMLVSAGHFMGRGAGETDVCRRMMLCETTYAPRRHKADPSWRQAVMECVVVYCAHKSGVLVAMRRRKGRGV